MQNMPFVMPIPYFLFLEEINFHLKKPLDLVSLISLPIEHCFRSTFATTRHLINYKILLFRVKVNEGETVLVHGASGAVGIACIQLLQALVKSVKVIGTAGSADGLELVKKCGAQHVYNHRKATYMSEIQSDYPKGVDVIVEMLANENLDHDLSKLIGQNGRVLIVGARDNVTINPRSLMKKESSVHGVALRAATAKETETAAADICSDKVAQFIDPAVDRSFSLAEADQAHVYVMESTGHKGKVVLSLNE